jgi:SAM-dependent methyltransferase
MSDHHQHQHQHGSGAGTDDPAMAELLDLDAEVLRTYLADVVTWLHDLTAGRPPHRILDLGSGTGTGTFALLEHFEDADAIAVDLSPHLLHRLDGKARGRGMADRIRTVQADLDAAWPAIGTVDLVWASSSLHHMADPDRVLSEVYEALRPGGVMALAELDSFPRFLPHDLGVGRPGLEERCHAALAEGVAAELPHRGADWGPRLAKAGFVVEGTRTFVIDLEPPLPAAAGRYAQASLRRMRTGLDGRLSADDLAALDTLLDSDGPEGIRRRDDLRVRADRTVWMGRRP